MTAAFPIDVAWYDQHVRLARHVIDQFNRRAQPPAGFDPATLLRDLATCQGWFTTVRPHWSRSSNTAAGYIQIGEFLLMILEPDTRRPGCYSCVTVVNGVEWKTWQTAYERSWIALAPPPPRPIAWDQAQMAEIRNRAWAHARSTVAGEAAPSVTGRWLSKARKASRDARDTFLRDQRARVEAVFAQNMARVDAEHRRDLEAIAHWEQVALPAYQRQWQLAHAANASRPPAGHHR